MTVDDAFNSLAVLLDQKVGWYQPIADDVTAQLRAHAVKLRDLVDEQPHPTLPALALMFWAERLLDWLVDPQDEHRINAVRRAYAIFAAFDDPNDDTNPPL